MLARFAVITGVLLVSASSAYAQKEPFRPASPAPTQAEPTRIRWFGEGGFASAGVVPDAAAREGLGTRGYGFNLGGGAEYGILSLGAGLSGMWLHDDSSFSQSTTGGQKSSSLMVFDYSLQAGVRLFSLQGDPMRIEGSVLAGVGGFFGSRSIDNCVDCTLEKVHLAGGYFFAPQLAFGSAARRTYLVASLRFYGGGSEGDRMLVVTVRRYF